MECSVLLSLDQDTSSHPLSYHFHFFTFPLISQVRSRKHKFVVVLVKDHPIISPSATTRRNLELRADRDHSWLSSPCNSSVVSRPPGRHGLTDRWGPELPDYTKSKSNKVLTHLGQSTGGSDLLQKRNDVELKGGLSFQSLVTLSHKRTFSSGATVTWLNIFRN